MIAVVFDGSEIRIRRDLPAPAPGPDEALLKVRLAGICSTDLEVVKGYMGFEGVMGHEFVGEVTDGPPAWQGKRAVAEINCVCGRCEMCRRGLSNHCFDRTVIGIDGRDGCFAKYIAVPVRNLHEIPDSVSDEQAVFVEPLAAAFQVIRQVRVNPGDDVVVLGDGRLGQLVARVLKQAGADPLLVGKHPEKLEAAEKVGIQTRMLEQFKPDKRTDLVVEATGSAGGMTTAMQAVRPRGTIVLKSTFAASEGLNLAPLVIDEVNVIGSRCGPFPEAVRALAENAVDVHALVTGRYPLTEAPEAIAAARSGKHIKVLLDVG
ncbi:MAG: MDR/zinc-dependent alcohol dehydrogenase-like family protein [Phycisphaerae bacterium]